MNVLALHGDPGIRELLRTAFTGSGSTVTVLSDPKMIQPAVSKEHFDLIILHDTPIKQSFETIIRMLKTAPPVPEIIIVSASFLDENLNTKMQELRCKGVLLTDIMDVLRGKGYI